MVGVLFVCLGNICRSPSAEGVFRKRVREAGLAAHFEIDSAGTGGYHVGRAPDARAQRAALRHGVDLSGLRARQVTAADFERFDYILAMDRQNLAALEALRPPQSRGRVELFLSYAAGRVAESEVPDPYYGGEKGFELMLDLIEAGAEGLLERLIEVHGLRRA